MCILFTNSRRDCLVAKLNIAKVSLNVDLEAKNKEIPSCDYYCDMLYKLEYSSFTNLPPEGKANASKEASSTISDDSPDTVNGANSGSEDASLPDLYSGCGAMSTGLCLGANMAGLRLVTKWAVDINMLVKVSNGIIRKQRSGVNLLKIF